MVSGKITKEDIESIVRLGIVELQPEPRKIVFGPDTPRPELPFTEQEYKDRLRRVRDRMAEQKVDLLYVTAPDSMYYFHGFNARYYRGHGSTVEAPMAGTAIHVDHDYMIHFNYTMEELLLRLTSIVNDIRFIPEEGSVEEKASQIAKELKTEGWLGGRVGMEFYSHVPNRIGSEALEKALRANGCREVVDVTQMTRAVRRVKSPQELIYIDKATQIAEIGHQAVKEVLRPGVTELEVYGEAIRAMSKAGGEPAAIPDAIASGPFITWHSWSTRRVIHEGDLVMYDPAAVFNRYHINVSRPYFVGDPPQSLGKFFKLVGGAFNIYQEIAKAGTPISVVCHALKQYYQEVGVWDLYSWAGGIEQSIAFPPDWVGEVFWDLEAETEGVFLENEVTNFYSMLNGLMIDSFAYEKGGARRLSRIAPELISVG
jgi:Xaa-Pro aminopeptidase